jgi:subtilase family serine protease
MAVAQKNASAALIVDKVDDGQLTMLRGNTLPVANAQNDVGRVSSNLAMKDLILVLKRSPEQQAAFDAFVASQYDASSPNFHQWLEPAEIGEKFGPSLADIATISSWLSGHGFSVDEVSKDRMTIRFGGTARQVESTFHTQIHNLTVRGEQHIANMSDPQIPMALEPVVAGVKALHNFFPRPLHRLGGTVTRNRDTGKWERPAGAMGTSTGLNTNAVRVQPELGITVGTGSNAYLVEDVTPYDFAAIYNVLPLWNAATPIDGTGQTIAIAGTSRIVQADLTSFRSIFGLPAGPALQTIVGNAFDPGVCTGTTGICTVDDQTENALDVEWSGAVAKGAQIVLVASGYNSPTSPTNDAVYDSSNYVIQHNTAKILNVSYGLCELFLGTGGNTTYNALWQSAAAQGIAVFVASGDSGSPACDQGQATSVPYGAQYGLSVSGLASTPYNTAVGGTDFDWGSTAAPYWGTTNSTTNGSNALSYMPEIPWNDTCTNPLALSYFQGWAKSLKNAGFNATSPTDGESACNFIVTWNTTIKNNTNPPVDLSGFVNSVGAGGGASNCTVNNTNSSTTTADPTSCTGGYAKPTWQAGVTGIPNDSKRDIPDVSFFASNGFLGSAYLICVSANGACVTSTSPTTEPTAQEIGGTSAASPAMAGVMALINQKAGVPQGNPNSELYTLAGKQTYSTCKTEGPPSNGCYFNDVDTGTIAMACTSGKPNCTVSHSGDTLGVMSGYDAAVGFELATGLGTLNVANVVNGWTSATGTGATTVTVVPASSSIVSNVALTVTGTVTGSLGTPTGTVTLTSGSYISSATALSTGAYSITIPKNSLSAGSDTLTVTYGGNPTYAIASGTAVVTVTAPPTPTVTVTPASSTVNSGQSLIVTGTVVGTSGTPTGTVKLAGGGYTSSATALSSGAYSITIPANSLSSGSDTLTVTYSGDAVYGTASGSAVVTVTASVFTLGATATTAVSRGSSATSTISVSTSTGYSGTVTLACALNTGGPTNSAADAPACSIPTAAVAVGGTATATVTTKAATTAALARPALPGRGLAGVGTVLALLVFLGIPARRRSWRTMLGVLALMVALGSLAACGGGGGGGGGGTSDPGTASGTYTFTVTGTGTPAVTPAPSKTFTVTVN